MTPSQPDSPLVSVIMIFRDAGRFIREAIDSIVVQSWPHWELLLVDDGSVDGSREIAEQYRQRIPERVRILEHPGRVNRGMSASRNLGLSAARGDHVAFLDADDVYLPERLERHVRQLARHPDAGVVQSCVEYWHSWANGETAGKRDTAERPPPVSLEVPVEPPTLLLIMLESLGATVPGICSITVRRSLLEAIGGSEEAFRAHYEDQVLFSKLYLSTKVVVIHETLARYRQHPASVSGRERLPDAPVPHPWYTGRTAFLDWLEARIAALPDEEALILESVRRARRKHLQASSPGTSRTLRTRLRGLAQRLLPAPVHLRLADLCGSVKLALSSRRAARAASRVARRLPAAPPAADHGNHQQSRN